MSGFLDRLAARARGSAPTLQVVVAPRFAAEPEPAWPLPPAEPPGAAPPGRPAAGFATFPAEGAAGHRAVAGAPEAPPQPSPGAAAPMAAFPTEDPEPSPETSAIGVSAPSRPAAAVVPPRPASRSPGLTRAEAPEAAFGRSDAAEGRAAEDDAALIAEALPAAETPAAAPTAPRQVAAEHRERPDSSPIFAGEEAPGWASDPGAPSAPHAGMPELAQEPGDRRAEGRAEASPEGAPRIAEPPAPSPARTMDEPVLAEQRPGPTRAAARPTPGDATPGAAAPAGAARGAAAPGAATPEAAAPGTATPEAAAPGTAPPEAAAPERTAAAGEAPRPSAGRAAPVDRPEPTRARSELWPGPAPEPSAGPGEAPDGEALGATPPSAARAPAERAAAMTAAAERAAALTASADPELTEDAALAERPMPGAAPDEAAAGPRAPRAARPQPPAHTVRIGRVEVRSPAPPARSAGPLAPTVGLAEYLGRRN